MNRQIKFRGKNKTGQWVYGYYVQHPSGTAFIVRYATSGAPEWHEVDPNTVGQYTGRQDMHGKPIFEGDVIFWIARDMRGRGRGAQGAVVWDMHTSAWVAHRDKPCSDCRPCIVPSWWHYLNIEVVGNVHDNPELMERR